MIKEVQVTGKTYDQIAPYYLHLTGIQREARRISEMWVDRFLDTFPAPGYPILDLGCGDGRDLEIFMARGVFSVGMDLSHTMLAYARRRLPRGFLVQMDLTSWGWKPRSFGGIWASGIIYHIPKGILKDVFDAMRRSLVPGGVLYFNYLVGSGEGMDQKPETSGGYPRFYALYQAQEIAQMLRGFRLLSWEPQHRNGNSLRVDHVLATSKG